MQTDHIHKAEENTEESEYVPEDTNYVEPEEKKIAITFDDGPNAACTPTLLQGLKDRNVKATFFVTGKNVEKNPQIVQQMYGEGHLIGNHTYSHIQLNEDNRETFKEEIEKTSMAVQEITGEGTLYVRPPYGSWDKEFEKELNMFPVLWDIDPKDWCSKDVGKIVETVCEGAEENAIILLHDQYETSVEAAFEIIDRLTKEGYEFVTVDKILFD